MKKMGWIVLLISSLFGVAQAAEKDATENLIALLKKMDSFEASFSQKIKSSTGEKISDTKGEVVIRRPNRFYWKSYNPDPVLVIADGKFLWTYDIDLEQATKQSLGKALKDSPATLLAGSIDNFKENFTIAYAKAGACQKGKEKCFRLKSKQKDSTFKDIVIGFEGNRLLEVSMSDPLGQKIYTAFSNVQVNRVVDDKLFNFIPAKGVDVIHYD